MSIRLEAVAFDVADPAAVATFWAELLGREVVDESGGALVPGDETQVGLRFVASDAEPTGRPRLHLHLTSESSERQRQTVDTVLRLGGRHLDIGQSPDETFVVLADPGGNELCVIEPGNNFLAGTGYLGEVTCDGVPAVGHFWRDALAWSLVWEQGDQTAIQAPGGGTKLSWDGWGSRPEGESRQRFDVVSSDPDGAADLLVSLGATRLRDLPDGFALADPGNIEFGLRRG